MNTEINSRTPEGFFANKTVSQKDRQYVVNLNGVNNRKEVYKVVNYLFGPLKNVGKLKTAGKEKYLWIPGSGSLEDNKEPKVTTLAGLLLALNKAQKHYRFELVYNTLLRIKILEKD